MLSRNVLRTNAQKASGLSIRNASSSHRCSDGRNRLSNFWTPTQRALVRHEGPENGHDLLVRAGFLRQAYSGIFHLLPLGVRVQEKIERLIDKHMQRLGASKASLSSISSEDLWQRSGRLDKGRTSELLQLEDRKGVKYLLSPTHEEEITTIVSNAVKSYKELPLRLYQISRKYRDEPRPRQGLLRGREFVMKDLYTFDATQAEAHETYEAVRRAYVAFLEDLRLPFLTARASSGNMGGDLSHEYHFASPQGEDTIITCDSCDYSLNEELYIGMHDGEDPVYQEASDKALTHAEVSFISQDRQQTCEIHFAAEHGEANIYAVKAIFPDVDTSVTSDQVLKEYELANKTSVPKPIRFRDPRLPYQLLGDLWSTHKDCDDPDFTRQIHDLYPVPRIGSREILLTKAQQGDSCPNCNDGKLQLHQAVEIGHTFHLGTRYSIPLEAQIRDADNALVPIEMGCHGIGVSRLIGAVASLLADKTGLNWPIAIAPFTIIIVPGPETNPEHVEAMYDRLTTTTTRNLEGHASDVLIDDREQGIGWKLKDADLVGYPFIIVMGKAWKEREAVELQCRRLGVKEEVELGDLDVKVSECIERL